jgi:hypothetical protein
MPLGYSAMVRMHLLVETRKLSVAQVGPDFLILEEPASFGPTRAELVVEIDGAQERTLVFLPDGIRATDQRTRMATALATGQNGIERGRALTSAEMLSHCKRGTSASNSSTGLRSNGIQLFS